MMNDTPSPTTGQASENTLDTVPPVLFDELGFLIDPAEWTETLAMRLAVQDGIGSLTKQHWLVIRFVRNRYLQLGAIPPVRSVCRNSTVSREELKLLFGSCFEVWRLAGLPDPGEEARNYMK